MHRETTDQFCSLVESYYKDRFVEVKAAEIIIQPDSPIFKRELKKDSFKDDLAFPLMNPRRMQSTEFKNSKLFEIQPEKKKAIAVTVKRL